MTATEQYWISLIILLALFLIIGFAIGVSIGETLGYRKAFRELTTEDPAIFDDYYETRKALEATQDA